VRVPRPAPMPRCAPRPPRRPGALRSWDLTHSDIELGDQRQLPERPDLAVLLPSYRQLDPCSRSPRPVV
jgi:hypothetical protein